MTKTHHIMTKTHHNLTKTHHIMKKEQQNILRCNDKTMQIIYI